MKLDRHEMTDTQKFYADVRRTGHEGAHSHDLARSIPSLNVSQRSKDCTSKGQQVYTRSERRNGRAGARFWLEQFAPSDATPVRPNGVEGGDGGEAVVSLDPDNNFETHVEPSIRSTLDEGEVVAPRGEAPRPLALCWHADYTLPNGPPKTEDGWYPVAPRRRAA